MFRSQRVLLVGNHQERLWRIQELLDPLAQAVFVAHSSHTAVELCKEFQFGAVLIDCEKMGAEGLETADYIRSEDKTREAPVILLGKSTLRGHDGYLGPFDIDDPNFLETISSKIHVRAPVESIRDVPQALDGHRATRSPVASGDVSEDLIAQVVADIADPLRGVLLTSEWLGLSARARLDDRERESLDILWNCGQRGIEIVRKLTEYVLVNEVEPHWEMVDCDVLLKACMRDLHASVMETRAGVAWNNLPPVWAVPALLKRVFLNLVDNAIRYRSAAAPLVTITCEQDDENCVFFVRDNGTGVPSLHVEEIFRPFAKRREKDSHGAGVGLAICRVALDRMGGRIWAQSGDSGSTFVFELPRQREKEREFPIDAA